MAIDRQGSAVTTLDQMLHGISLQALVIFSTVVELESFSQAAEKLGVSQPTISFQIGGLEASCGVRLFNRKPKLMLTDVGRDLYTRTRLVLNRLDELTQALENTQKLQTGQISLGYSATRCALPIVGRFMERNPSIRIRTTAGNTQQLLQELTNCQIDVAIVGLEDPPLNLECRLLRKEELCLLVPADHRLSKRRSVKFSDVAGLRFITREPGSMTRALFEKASVLSGQKPLVALEVPGKDGMREAVAAGIGVGISLTSETGSDPRISWCRLTDPVLSAGTYSVYLKENIELPAVRALVEIADGK